MNRLVIVGNGFDLAHGLPTGYCDFINHFWRNLRTKYKDDFVEQFVYINPKFDIFKDGDISNFKEFENQLSTYAQYYQYNYNTKAKTLNNNFEKIFHFRNEFFKIICCKQSIQNWVDIENEYYQLLKKTLTSESSVQIKNLNNEFEKVKDLLELYLREEICEKFNFDLKTSNLPKLQSIFSVMNRFTERQRYLDEFSQDDKKELISYQSILKKYNFSGSYDISSFLKQEKADIENLFLNFNYTPTLEPAIKGLVNDDIQYYGESRIIYIHGKIDDKNNKINFGFGDEMDSDYKYIEEKDNNEYLKNIKSFQYLQNSNYRTLLNFIESRKFQVYLMGHSCGLSDRILLNTIFEHNNCRSIKIFYYKFSESRPDGREDNYTDIVQNISRHFNKKKLMRDKIVNKQLCSPLPQDIRLSMKQNLNL